MNKNDTTIATSNSNPQPSKVAVIDFSLCSGRPKRPLNPLGRDLRIYIWDQLHRHLADASITSIVLYGGKAHGNFSAGADLKEFNEIGSALQKSSSNNTNTDSSIPTLLDVVQAVEDSPKPIVAAIQGVCLGGGCELALACHARVCASAARSNTKLGLPEVHVGVIPGAGGTLRLPRLIGLPAALQMILTGMPCRAERALQLGLVDEIVKDNNDDALLEKARQWAAFSEVLPLRRTGQLKLRESPAEVHTLLHMAQLGFPKNGTVGLEAALTALRAAQLPLAQGQAVELEQFLTCLVHPQGIARRHVFWAVRQAQQPPRNLQSNNDNIIMQNHPLLKPQSCPVAVIGAGTMGGGIAVVLLQAGFQPVHLVDVNAQALAKGRAWVLATLAKSKKKAKVSQHLRTTQQLTDLADCQLVVEAVVEKMAVKRQIFAQLDQIVQSPHALLLSNTSTLSMDGMAQAVQPARQPYFAGWHFFSPAHMMKLVEIVRGQHTSDATVALLQIVTKRVGKTGVVVGNCDGFCGNRLLKPYTSEMVLLLVEHSVNMPASASIAAIDQALVDFGMALGPFAMSDLAGNDVGYYVRVERGWARNPATPNVVPANRPDRYTEFPDVMVSEHGRLGQKAGKGWYDYDPQVGRGRTPLPSPFMDELVAKYAAAADSSTKNTQQRSTPLAPHEIIERVLYPLVNEGFKCLEEGIVQRPGDVDVVYVYGYGWPVFTGGPMHWADTIVTLPVLLQKLQSFYELYPTTEHYQPSRLLRACVQQGVTVHEYYRRNNDSASQKTHAKL